jgi:hypothetical protein
MNKAEIQSFATFIGRLFKVLQLLSGGQRIPSPLLLNITSLIVHLGKRKKEQY